MVYQYKRELLDDQLRQFGGHDSLITTEIYLKLSPEDAIREY